MSDHNHTVVSPAILTISMTTSSKAPFQEVRLQVRDQKSGAVIELTVSLDDWARASFSQSMMDIQSVGHNLDKWGKKRVLERRTLTLKDPCSDFQKDALSVYVELLNEHTLATEPEWKVNPYLGSQGSVIRDFNGNITLNYSVYRYVSVDETNND